MASTHTGSLLKYLLSIAAFISAALCTAEPRELNADSVRDFFDIAFATQSQDHRIVGAVVSVVHDGEVIFKKGYGWANLESRTPADPDRTLFRIASISKPFVWTAVMQLVQDGRLELEDDVNDHLVAFKMPETFPEPIRIRHLMTHTPGLEDRAIGMNARSAEEKQTLEAYLTGNMPARVRPPGIRAAYSNWSTTLAAYIVQEVSGEPWADYIDAHILAPLGMQSTNTQTLLSEEFASRMATSYTWSGGAFRRSPYEFLNDEPAGVISTTADDMTRFMLAQLNPGALAGERILSDEATRQMHSPLFDPHPGISPMLHGFYRTDRRGQIIYGHGGDTNQFHSQLSLFPEHDLGVFISFNSDPADAARSRLTPAFVDYFFPTPYLRAAPAAVATELDQYVGEYIPLRSATSTIERLGTLVTALSLEDEGGELILNGSSRWVPQGDDRFVGRYADNLLIFEREAGEVTHMMINEPLSTFRKVSGLDAPKNQQRFIGLMILIAVITVFGYGYRAFARAPEVTRLPAGHVIAAWVHALLLIGLYLYLANTLSGDVEEFVFGVPADARINIWLLAANSLLGGLVVFFAARHWQSGLSTNAVRIRYSFVALAALMNLWVAHYFNLLAFPFQS